jgi:FixJ family two-component response regulator
MAQVDDRPLISVVDDDEGVRHSLDGLVRSLGYRVAIFSSAEAFLGSAERSQSACVISDIRMPGMCGLDMTEALVAGGGHAPVILISSFLDERMAERARAAGACCFLKKPFDGDVLIACLNKAIARGWGSAPH